MSSPEPKNKLQALWMPILKPHHTQWEVAYRKIRTKISGVKARYGFDISKHILYSYGQPCPYCGHKLKYQNMSVDHMTPQSKGGEDSLDNIEVICGRCNRRKGTLDKKAYELLIGLIKDYFIEEDQRYIFRKLSSFDRGGGVANADNRKRKKRRK